MRNKTILEKKIDKVESIITTIEYHVARNEREPAYVEIDKLREVISTITTLLNTEEQD